MSRAARQRSQPHQVALAPPVDHHNLDHGLRHWRTDVVRRQFVDGMTTASPRLPMVNHSGKGRGRLHDLIKL